MNRKTCACQTRPEQDSSFQELTRVLDLYRSTPGALIPVLQAAQDLYGYISDPVLHRICESLGEPVSKAYGVITFYSFFSQVPRGAYLIRVCMGTACYVLGANEVLTSLKKELGIEIGQTTPDRLFSLEVGRCFGACGLAPVLMVNDDVHQRVSPSGIPAILRDYRKRAAGTEASDG